MKIYDTDEVWTIDKVWNNYSMEYNIFDIQDIIKEGKVPKEKYADEFLKRIYEHISTIGYIIIRWILSTSDFQKKRCDDSCEL